MGGERPDWLPVGWKVSVKIRSCGRKDKYYISPSNGLKFNSKVEVLRYLKSSVKDEKPKELNKIEIEKTAAEKLPPGWIKEIRTKKKGGKTRKDPYYIDPVSGRHFRSMQEVYRYLESKDSGELESKPDDKVHISDELADQSQSSSAEAKGLRSTDKKTDENVTWHGSLKSGPVLASRLRSASRNNADKPEDNHLELKEDYSLAIELSDKLQLANTVKQHADVTEEFKRLADDKVDKSVDEVTKNVVNGKEQHTGERRRSTRLADGKPKDNVTENQSLHLGSEVTVEKNVDMPGTDGLELKEKENNSLGEGLVHQKKRKNSNSKWTSDLPRRTSKRLARAEVDPSLEVKADKNAEADAGPSGVAEGDTTKNLGKSGLSDEPDTDTTGKSVRLNDSHKPPPKSRTKHPNMNQNEKTVTQENSPSLEEHDDKKQEKNLNSSLKDLLLDPCIEFAIKTLTGAIPIEDVYKVGEKPLSSLASPNQTSASSSKMPSGDIWGDPCFEFAVKTLTGEVPKEDGCNSLTLPKIRLENANPLNYSSGQFNCDVKKPYMRQQGARDTTFPRAVSGGSQSFVGAGVHHGVQRRRGNIKFV